MASSCLQLTTLCRPASLQSCVTCLITHAHSRVNEALQAGVPRLVCNVLRTICSAVGIKLWCYRERAPAARGSRAGAAVGAAAAAGTGTGAAAAAAAVAARVVVHPDVALVEGVLELRVCEAGRLCVSSLALGAVSRIHIDSRSASVSAAVAAKGSGNPCSTVRRRAQEP